MKIFYRLLVGLCMLVCETMPITERFVQRSGTTSSSTRTFGTATTPVAAMPPVPMSELIAACPDEDPTLSRAVEFLPKDTRSAAGSRNIDPILRQQQAAERKAQFKTYLACLFKFYRNGIRKGFAAQKEQLQQKIKKIQDQLSSALSEQFSLLRKFTPQEWDFLMRAVDSYFVALNVELDVLMQQTQIDVEHPQGREIYYRMLSKETTKMGNAAKITEFVNYLASLKGKGKNDTMVTNLRDTLTAASPETAVIGSECAGLEFLLGSNYAQLTDDEKKYVDQIGCPASGYFKGA